MVSYIGRTRPTDGSSTTYQSIHTSPDPRLEAGIALKPVKELLLTFDLYSKMDYATGFELRPAAWLALRMAASEKHDQLLKRERFYLERRVFGLAWGTGLDFKPVAIDFAYYRPYGNEDSVSDTPSTGAIEISPTRNDLVMLAITLAF